MLQDIEDRDQIESVVLEGQWERANFLNAVSSALMAERDCVLVHVHALSGAIAGEVLEQGSRTAPHIKNAALSSTRRYRKIFIKELEEDPASPKKPPVFILKLVVEWVELFFHGIILV